MTKTHTPTEESKKQRDNRKTRTKTLITQRLRTDLGRSVGVTTVTPLVWLNRFTGAKRLILKEKETDPTQSYDKNPYTDRRIKKATRQHKDATKSLNYTTIADRRRTVSRSNDSYPTDVVKPVFWILTLQLTAKFV